MFSTSKSTNRISLLLYHAALLIGEHANVKTSTREKKTNQLRRIQVLEIREEWEWTKKVETI